MKEKFKLTALEKSWIGYDIGNSAFILLVTAIVPIYFNALTDAAGNLQNLDIEKLNDLIAALEKTAAQMEKTSAAFGKLFGK